MLKPLALGALLVALGTWLGWMLAAPRAGVTSASALPPRDDHLSVEILALRDSVEELRRVVDGHSSTALPAPAPARDVEIEASSLTEERTLVPSGPSLADVAAQIATLEQAVAALRDAAAKGTIPARFPSYEMLQRSSATADWSLLQPFVDAARMDDLFAMKHQVKWRSQEEILGIYGRPTEIWKDGTWYYEGPFDERRRLHHAVRSRSSRITWSTFLLGSVQEPGAEGAACVNRRLVTAERVHPNHDHRTIAQIAITASFGPIFFPSE